MNKVSTHKILSDYGMTDYYLFYRKTVRAPQFKTRFAHNSDLIADKKLYTRVINALHKKMVQRALDGNIVNFPHNFGSISVRKRKMNYSAKNKLKLDYKHFKKTGQKIYHLNENRNGYRYFWYWRKFRAHIPTKTFYKLRTTRFCTRSLAKILLNTDKDYLELIKNKRIYID